MSWFRRKPVQTRRVSVQSPTDCGHRLLDLPPRDADVVEALQAKFEKLDLENDALVQSAAILAEAHKREHERQQRRIDNLIEEKEALRQALANGERRELEREAQDRRASVVDAFRRQGGVVTNPLGHLQVHPNVLTDDEGATS